MVIYQETNNDKGGGNGAKGIGVDFLTITVNNITFIIERTPNCK